MHRVAECEHGGDGELGGRAQQGLHLGRRLGASLAAPEAFGTYLGLGLTCIIAFQATVNMCVAMGLLPTKGLTLPFVSYGGSSLVVLMGAAGVLLSLSASAEGVMPAGCTEAKPMFRTSRLLRSLV